MTRRVSDKYPVIILKVWGSPTPTIVCDSFINSHVLFKLWFLNFEDVVQLFTGYLIVWQCHHPVDTDDKIERVTQSKCRIFSAINEGDSRTAKVAGHGRPLPSGRLLPLISNRLQLTCLLANQCCDFYELTRDRQSWRERNLLPTIRLVLPSFSWVSWLTTCPLVTGVSPVCSIYAWYIHI